MYRGWICEGCLKGCRYLEPWNCPGCGKEICDNCGWMLAHCKDCASTKTERELAEAANAAGWNFEVEFYGSRPAV